MRASSVFSAAILLVANVWAATINQPSQATVWDTTNQGQAVTWTSVPTDPTTFTLKLANNVIYPNINLVLKQNVSTAAGSTTVDAPPNGWPNGTNFQINIVQQNPTGDSILAQSQQFNISGNSVAFSSSVKPSGTSSGNSPGSTGTKNNGELGLTVQTGFVAGLALVGALLA